GGSARRPDARRALAHERRLTASWSGEASTTESGGGVRQKGQASSQQASLSVPQAAFDAGALLYGADWVSVGDRASVGGAGQRAAIASSGSGTTLIGTDARVGSIWSTPFVSPR